MLQLFQPFRPAVFHRRHAAAPLKCGSKLALVQIAHLFGYFADRCISVCQQTGGLIHAQLQEIGGDVLAIDAAEIIFQAGFTDIELVCDIFGRTVFLQIAADNLLCLLGNACLRRGQEGVGDVRLRHLSIQKLSQKRRKNGSALCRCRPGWVLVQFPESLETVLKCRLAWSQVGLTLRAVFFPEEPGREQKGLASAVLHLRIKRVLKSFM